MSVDVVETNLEFREEPVDRAGTDFFVVHHIGEITRDVDAAEVHQWHLANGWIGIGYHYLIKKDGTIERGRPKASLGSHCYGSNNYSVGIVLTGDSNKEAPTQEQINSLVGLLADLCSIYGLTPSRETIVGHREKCGTDCPGEGIYNLLDDISKKVADTLAE